MADYNAMFNHPLTVLGAGMMQGFDPRMEGFGGMGAGLMGAGAHIRQQQQLAAEQARQKQMADLQMRAFQNKLAQQQAAAQQEQQFTNYVQTLPENERMKAMAAGRGAYMQSALRGASSAQTGVGKLNADLASGAITKPQYDAALNKLQQEGTGHISVTPLASGGFVTVNQRDMTADITLPGGQSKKISIGGGGTPSVTPVAAPETMPAPEMQPVEPTEEADPFVVQQRVQAIKNLPNTVQTSYTASEDAVRELPNIIQKVSAQPEAFSRSIGGSYYLPDEWQGGAVSKAYTEAQEANLNPQQKAARVAVFRNASDAIKKLSGAAVSGAEQERINTFMPKANDTTEVILTKLRDAQEYANRTMGGIAESYGIPGVEAPEEIEQPWTEYGGLKYREKR